MQTTQNFSSPVSDEVLDKYIRNIRAMSKATAHEYYFRLTTFQKFITEEYKDQIHSN